MKINIFHRDSPLFSYRWLIVLFLVVAGIVSYYDLTGRRLFDTSGQEQWNAGGPGYHK